MSRVWAVYSATQFKKILMTQLGRGAVEPPNPHRYASMLKCKLRKSRLICACIVDVLRNIFRLKLHYFAGFLHIQSQNFSGMIPQDPWSGRDDPFPHPHVAKEPTPSVLGSRHQFPHLAHQRSDIFCFVKRPLVVIILMRNYTLRNLR